MEPATVSKTKLWVPNTSVTSMPVTMGRFFIKDDGSRKFRCRLDTESKLNKRPFHHGGTDQKCELNIAIFFLFWVSHRERG